MDLKSKIQAITYESSAPTQMTVVNEQMDTTGTSAVLFGAVGAFVVAAHDDNVDSASAKSIQAALGEFPVKPIMDEKIATTLAQHNVIIAPAADAKLVVNVVAWGLRRNSRDTQMLVPFVVQDIVMTNAKNEVLWQKREVSVGNHPDNYGNYLANPQMLRTELDKTIKQAAETVSYQIIFN